MIRIIVCLMIVLKFDHSIHKAGSNDDTSQFTNLLDHTECVKSNSAVSNYKTVFEKTMAVKLDSKVGVMQIMHTSLSRTATECGCQRIRFAESCAWTE